MLHEELHMFELEDESGLNLKEESFTEYFHTVYRKLNIRCLQKINEM
jgi:hypothetical protein